MSTTLAQQRAAFSLAQLETVGCQKDFKGFSAGLPALILQNGFGQTLAFLLAKAKNRNLADKHYAALKIILAWLVECNLLPAGNEKMQIMEISQMDQMSYLHAQRETLAMLEWLKRYANADLFMENQA